MSLIRLTGLIFLVLSLNVEAAEYTTFSGLPIELDIEEMEVRTNHTASSIIQCEEFEVCLEFYSFLIIIPDEILEAEGVYVKTTPDIRVVSLPFMRNASLFGKEIIGREIRIYRANSDEEIAGILYSDHYGVVGFKSHRVAYWMSGACGIYASEECKRDEGEE